MGRVQAPSVQLAPQLLRSDLVELRPSQFSLRLRESRLAGVTNRDYTVRTQLVLTAFKIDQ